MIDINDRIDSRDDYTNSLKKVLKLYISKFTKKKFELGYVNHLGINLVFDNDSLGLRFEILFTSASMSYTFRVCDENNRWLNLGCYYRMPLTAENVDYVYNLFIDVRNDIIDGVPAREIINKEVYRKEGTLDRL